MAAAPDLGPMLARQLRELADRLEAPPELPIVDLDPEGERLEAAAVNGAAMTRTPATWEELELLEARLEHLEGLAERLGSRLRPVRSTIAGDPNPGTPDDAVAALPGRIAGLSHRVTLVANHLALVLEELEV